MGHIALTGANGFLGWHTRIALLSEGKRSMPIKLGSEFDIEEATSKLDGASRLIHLAGVNRGEEDEVEAGNLLFAQQIAQALHQSSKPPSVIVFANSIQSKLENVYGIAKHRSAEVLEEAANAIGAKFINVMLPNLYGEHGKPFYNAVTATFCHLLAEGKQPTIQQDLELTLMHAQNAADILMGSKTIEKQSDLEVTETVGGLLLRLKKISLDYSSGDIPDISDAFDRDLFNTYRSYTIDALTPIQLKNHADDRGSFFEIVRAHGGEGQTSFSQTVPGISRGDHFHRRKVERFTVLAGKADISMRRLFSDTVLSFEVSGESPVAIDMPTGWTHKITNTGDKTLYTSFWSNEIFDPESPDTIAEAV